MATLPEFIYDPAEYPDGIYQIELTDRVQGGPDGITNWPARQLASRTRFLKDQQEAHQAAEDPHPQYMTEAEVTQLIEEAGGAGGGGSGGSGEYVDWDTFNEIWMGHISNSPENDPHFNIYVRPDDLSLVSDITRTGFRSGEIVPRLYRPVSVGNCAAWQEYTDPSVAT